MKKKERKRIKKALMEIATDSNALRDGPAASLASVKAARLLLKRL